MPEEIVRVLSIEDNADYAQFIRDTLYEAAALGWDLPQFKLTRVDTLAAALARLDEIPAGPSYNLDLRRWVASWKKSDVPFTPPVSLIRAQKVALDLIEAEGLENKIARTRRLASGTRAALEAMGLKLISSSPSDSVTGAFYPEGEDDSALRGALRDKHGIHIAGGQDGAGAKWKGKIFRLSHMGFVDKDDTLAALSAIETEFVAAGAEIKDGVAIEAFNRAHG